MVKKKRGGRIKLDEGQKTFSPTTSTVAPNSRPKNVPVDPNSGTELQAQTPFPAARGASGATPAGVSIFDPQNGATEDGGFSGDKPTVQLQATGNSGTQIFGGYFSEEYLSNLRGRRAAAQWDEMRRSEAQISMLLNAIMNPIKSANWDVDPYDPTDAECVKHADLAKFCLFEGIDFNTFKGEALTVIPFGFALMEVVDKVIFNHPKFGTINALKALAFRSQKTIENWQLEQKTGRLLGVNQYTYSDLGGNQFIPGEFLLCFTHLKEGDNYEGIAALRPMLGAYKRKELYLKLTAIGVERYAVGTVVGTVPKGKEKDKEYELFKQTLQNYTSHECSYITLPEGWKVEIQKGEFDASKIKELLTFENTEFANAVVGNFLQLGMNGGGGAYSLGSNLGEFFTTGIQAYADLICDVVNRDLIPRMVRLNAGPQRGYPKLKVTGISDKAGKELAETIKFLTDSRALDPDKPLKEHLRKLYKLPKPDPTTAVALPAIPAGASANYPKPNDPVIDPLTGKQKAFNVNQLSEHAKTIKLADKKYVAQFDANKEKLKALMQAQLSQMYSALKDVLRKRYKSLSGSDKILAAKGVEIPGLNAYKALLREALSDVAAQSLANARKHVPFAKSVKLADKFATLPPKVRKLIDAQATLVAETQAGDIEKVTFFQFTSTATTQDDIDAILNDVDESVEPMIEGSTKNGMSVDAAAGDVIAHVAQASSMALYMEPEVLDGIESFTFFNEDPVSEICQELNGTTFAVGDPDLDQYSPPLHHNCKSRLIPNLKGESDNPDIDRGGLSITQKALDSITLCEHSAHDYKLSEDAGRNKP